MRLQGEGALYAWMLEQREQLGLAPADLADMIQACV